jgi:hypothetical protein
LLFTEEAVGKKLTALTASIGAKKRWRRSTGVLVAVALSEFKVGVAWRCGVVEFRRLRKGGMWVLRTPRRLVKQGFRKETYLGYVGEAEAEGLRGLASSSFRWRWEAFMSHTEDREWLKRYWVKILKKSEAWKLLRNKKPRAHKEPQKELYYAPDSWVEVWTRSYYPLLKHMTIDLSLVDVDNEESRRVFFTKIVPRLADGAKVPVKAAVMAFSYALNRFEGGYNPQAVRLFMPPLDEVETEEEFNRVALEVERKIVRAVGLQRWRVRNMWLYKNFLKWLKTNLNALFEAGDLWDQLHGKYSLNEDTRMRG